MHEFYINIPHNYESAEQRVVDHAIAFPWNYYRHNPERIATTDQKLVNFFEDLQIGRFWGVLRTIDGCANPPGLTIFGSEAERREAPKEAKEARIWAKETFSDRELQEILDICVDTALTVPHQTAWPGTYKGHSILYRELVLKPDSMFAGAVTNPIRQHLLNGRFWEELPDMSLSLNGGLSIRIIDDILTNHYSDLHPIFAKLGYQFFARNYGETHEFSLNSLSAKGVERYGEFVNLLRAQQKSSGLTDNQLRHLGRPCGVRRQKALTV